MASFKEQFKPLNTDPLKDIKADAFAEFMKWGLPSNDSEEWRLTPLNGFRDAEYVVVNDSTDGATREFAQSRKSEDEHFFLIHLGQLDHDLSDPGNLPEGISVSPLSHSLEKDPALLKRILDQSVIPGQNGLTQLNLAFLSHGIHIRFHQNFTHDKPIHLLYENSAEVDSPLIHPHLIVEMGTNSKGTIIEEFASQTGDRRWINGTTGIFLRDNARLDHIVLNDEMPETIQTNRLTVSMDTFSTYQGYHFNMGGKLVRQDCQINLQGIGSSCTNNTLMLLDQSRHSDLYSWQVHRAPETTSSQKVKMILKDRVTGVFNGRVIVDPKAQKTDARQSNRNLLLSPNALVYSNPQLEINADDVKCSHGSTTGELDEEALFYLQSRGISRENARALLIEGFAGELLDFVPVKAVRDRLNRRMNTWLSDGRII